MRKYPVAGLILSIVFAVAFVYFWIESFKTGNVLFLWLNPIMIALSLTLLVLSVRAILSERR